ncbi:MAG: DUF1640 domain-containing protein [Rhodoferax sp.]|nr:DUF1640 domain-containing protein [Rhodoferax sp.]
MSSQRRRSRNQTFVTLTRVNPCMLSTMSSITLDAHKFVRKLQEAGFDEKQAEGLTEAMRSAIDDSELATRRDLREFELRLEPRFEAIKGDMAVLKWMMGALIAIAAANFAKQF